MGSKAAVVLCLAIALAGPVYAQQEPTGAWSTNNPSGSAMPTGWQFSNSSNGMTSDGTYMYFVGGYQYYSPGNTGFPGYYATARRYDPTGNSWTTLAYMPIAVYGGNSAAYYSGRVYSFGNGYYGNGSIYRYTISTNSWSTLSVTLSNNRYYAAAALLGTKIYITGGGFPSNLVDEFDPDANSGAGSITARATLSQARYYHACAAIPGLNKLYVVGGYNAGYLASCEEYTPPGAPSGANTWRTMAPITLNNSPTPRYGPAAFSLVNRLYVAGGYNAGYTNTTFELNPLTGATGTWYQRANITYGRYLHAGTAHGSNAAYIYGGYSNGGGQTLERFTPPNFGLPPNEPTDAGQTGSRPETALQSKSDTSQFDGWTNNQVQFTATVSDPDLISAAPQQVRFRVQVKPQSASWTSNQVTSLQTNLGAQGTHTLSWNIPADGGYDWRWRVEDSYSNSFPVNADTWVEAFGTEAAPNTNSPDFRSDQVPPSDPIADEPHNTDFQVPDPNYGAVRLNWIESTDNGPVAGIQYEIQVARDGGFLDIEAQLFSPAGTYEFPVTLSVSRYDKFWRIRAKDIGGNLSNWSPPLNFRVTYNDGIDHGKGDAKKACGMTATAVPALGSALLGLAILGLASLRRMRK